MEGWEYRLKLTDDEGDWLKGVATNLGMTNKGAILAGIRKLEQGSVEMNIDVIQEQLHELTDAIVNMQRVINSLSVAPVVPKTADAISSSFFDN